MRDRHGFRLNGKKYIKMMENDDNVVFEYILAKREEYWGRKQSGTEYYILNIIGALEYVKPPDHFSMHISYRHTKNII